MVPSMNDAPLRLVCSSFPDEASALHAARTVVHEQLAACVQILPGITSVYRWQDQLTSSQEVLAVFKCPSAGAAALSSRLLALHPYEVPEIVSTGADAAGPYLAWALDACRLSAPGVTLPTAIP
jgi:periplasmic divalent cation tolerance protein